MTAFRVVVWIGLAFEAWAARRAVAFYRSGAGRVDSAATNPLGG